jgi:hypothetical protein
MTSESLEPRIVSLAPELLWTDRLDQVQLGAWAAIRSGKTTTVLEIGVATNVFDPNLPPSTAVIDTADGPIKIPYRDTEEEIKNAVLKGVFRDSIEHVDVTENPTAASGFVWAGRDGETPSFLRDYKGWGLPTRSFRTPLGTINNSEANLVRSMIYDHYNPQTPIAERWAIEIIPPETNPIPEFLRQSSI